MADNFNITEGNGKTMAAKEDGSQLLHQKVLAEFDVSGTPTLVSASAPMPVQPILLTTGGYSSIRLSDIDETEETVKNAAGQLHGFHVYNADGSNDVFLHFYDAASPDTSSDTPKLSFKIEAGQEKEMVFPAGIPFATAITVGALTTWAPGATGPDANEVNGTFFYK